jgi:hypothetical protein
MDTRPPRGLSNFQYTEFIIFWPAGRCAADEVIDTMMTFLMFGASSGLTFNTRMVKKVTPR